MLGAVLAAIVAAAGGAAHAQTPEENATRCLDASKPDLAIVSCSALIKSGQGGIGRAMALGNRGNAYVRKGKYAEAIADFSAAIKLKPDYPEAFKSRGHARFFTGQFAAAASDFSQRLRLDPSDVYRVLWLHLANSRGGAADIAQLSRNAATLDLAKWPGAVVNLYLGKSTPEQVRAAAADASQNCEAAFYIGEYELLRRNNAAARDLFQEAANSCPQDFWEYQGAFSELRRLP